LRHAGATVPQLQGCFDGGSDGIACTKSIGFGLICGCSMCCSFGLPSTLLYSTFSTDESSFMARRSCRHIVPRWRQSDDEIYTGAVVVVQPRGDRCWQMMLDTRTKCGKMVTSIATSP
jgi:hypothetical protein